MFLASQTGEGPAVDGAWEDVQVASSRLMSQEGVFQLTQDLRMFSETLSDLKSVFCEEKDELEQSLRVAAHERLGELLKVLKNIVNKYTELNSTGILNAAEHLISHIKNFNYEREEEVVPPEIFSAINNLALAFSSSVSECLVGDINISPSQTLSYEDLPQQSGHQSPAAGPYDHASEILTDDITTTAESISPIAASDAVADVLSHVTESLDICFERAKAWSKYANDLITYVKKRAHIELEYSKQLTKLSQATRGALSEQSFLPFQSLYCTSLDNDKEYATTLVTTYQNFILAHKFVEPLQARRQEHDKQHKLLRETWRKAKRRLEEAEVNLRKAKQQYQIRNQEYQKAKEALVKADQQTAVVNDPQQNRQASYGTNSSTVLGASSLTALPTAKVEKRKRQEDDSYLKATQAEHYYRACVNEANHRRKELERKEDQYLKTLRDLMTQCDQTTKTVTLSFFQLNCDLVSPLRVQFQALLDESKNYEPGFQYAEYLKHVTPRHIGGRLDYRFEPYVTEGTAYFEPTTGTPRAEVPGNSLPISGQASQLGVYSAPRKTGPNRGFSDTESSSSRSLDDISPAASPGDPPNRKEILRRRPSTEGSLSSEELLDDVHRDGQDQGRLHPPQNLENVLSSSPESSPAPPRSQFPKVMRVVRDAFKGMKRTAKPTIFGVDFSVVAQESPDGVPFIVKKCIAEIDNRALNVKGIYRVNGVKNRVEKLCSLLDNPQCVRTDISEHLPHDISGVLKYFLRQLPEPLLLHGHYSEFLDVAKEYTDIMNASKGQDEVQSWDDERVQSITDHVQEDRSEKLYASLNRMRSLIEKLPEANRNTLQYIVAHLSRVAEHQSVNKMTASNLAIIFGPTLLRPIQESGKELQSLIELPCQSQAVEMLITHRNKIFDGYPHQASHEDTKDAVKIHSSPEDSLPLDESERDVTSLTPNISSQYLKSQRSVLSSASSGDVLENSEHIDLVVEDGSFSASHASALDSQFAESSLNECTLQRQTENSDVSNGQSNGGLNMVDDGREVFPHSIGIKRNSSSCGLPKDLTRNHNVVSIESSAATHESVQAEEHSSRPVSLSPERGVSGQGFRISERKHTPEGLAPFKSTEIFEQRGRKLVEEHQARTSDSVPVAPARLKSRGKRLPKNFDHSQMESIAAGGGRAINKPVSPHRPRSRRVSDYLISGKHDSDPELKAKNERSRRTSMIHSSKSDQPAEPGPRKHPGFVSPLHPSAVKVGDISGTEMGAAAPRLPHIPQSHPVSMPGRTPPFSKVVTTWSFVKADLVAGEPQEERELQIGDLRDILPEEGNEEVSFC